MTTGIYCRVSTTGQNLEGQKREIQKWIDGNGVTDPIWFTDEATGNNTERPGFKDLQKAIFNGEIKTLVVYKVDRISRNMVEGINLLQDWLSNGIRVVSVTQLLDFSGTMGSMCAAMLFAVAEMETELRKERQSAGIAVAKAQGKYKGRKIGSKKLKHGSKRAKELVAKGNTYREVAKALGVSVGTVSNYLKTS